MFTGIISHQGLFRGYRLGKREIAVEVPTVSSQMEIGQSIALNGVCLSLVRKERDLLFFNLSAETLRLTNLGSLHQGQRLNIELPLTPGSLLSGHLISGHIDAKGKVLRIVEKKPGKRLTVFFPAELRKYLILKGSISLNGVSLTIASLAASKLEVELIPITLKNSNLGEIKCGDELNIECDIIGKYVYNWITYGKL